MPISSPAFSRCLALDTAVIECRDGAFEGGRSRDGIEILSDPWLRQQVEYGLHSHRMLWSCCACVAFHRWLDEGNRCELGPWKVVVRVVIGYSGRSRSAIPNNVLRLAET